MKQRKEMFCRKEFLVFMFVFFLTLLNWPFILIFDKGHPRLIFYYLFLLWAVIIIALFLVGQCYSQKFDPEEEKKAED